MLERASPFAQCGPSPGLSQQSCAVLLQYHAWPDSYAQMAAMLATQCGGAGAPAPGRAISGARGTLLRIHPQRLWLVSSQGDASRYPALGPEVGGTLDLSHARTIIRVDKDIAVPLLSRFIAVDLRPDRFAVDDVALTPLHRVSVVLWRRPEGIDILAPRSFARSLWEVLAAAAERPS